MQRQIVAGALIVACLVMYYVMFSAPADFPSESLVVIQRGAVAGAVAEQLADARVIRSPFLFKLLLRLDGSSGDIQMGAYRFESPQNLFIVARRLVRGDYGLPPIRLTFVEGVTVREMATQVEEALPQISRNVFLTAARSHEGYLFPDTYFLSPSATAESIITTMRANFDTKAIPFFPEIQASGHSLSDIVIMASLVEKEARTSESRKIVAGILWNRLARGMLLQVDAVFGYIYDRDTFSPSFADLQVQSPYNTYLHKGLPPTPINNPGLDSLRAVLNPTKTDYVYYLTGKDNLMHYATTYAGHRENQRRYLNKN